jgi:hypothetical protein
MKAILMVAGAVALASATVAYAADDEEAATESADADKVICKTERVTGSRTRTSRICMTRAQWDELAAATKAKVDKFQSDGTMRRDGQTTNN